jgi:hypothetical protein
MPRSAHLFDLKTVEYIGQPKGLSAANLILEFGRSKRTHWNYGKSTPQVAPACAKTEWPEYLVVGQFALWLLPGGNDPESDMAV